MKAHLQSVDDVRHVVPYPPPCLDADLVPVHGERRGGHRGLGHRLGRTLRARVELFVVVTSFFFSPLLPWCSRLLTVYDAPPADRAKFACGYYREFLRARVYGTSIECILPCRPRSVVRVPVDAPFAIPRCIVIDGPFVNQNITPCCRRDDLRRLHTPHRGSHQQSNMSCQQISHSSRAILIPIV